MEQFEIRQGYEGDHPYLYSTWTQGLFAACPCHRATPRSIFFAKHANPLTKRMIEDPTTKILVACLPDAPDVILSYIIYTPSNKIHWCHTKEAFKGHGIAKALFTRSGLPIRGCVATSYSRDVKELMVRLDMSYDPYQER